jgi:molybdopterin-guanine dinucleotide biosynthesis protein MobB
MVNVDISVPRFGFCGFSNSGKTTVIEKLLPLLVADGLTVGYLKHDAHWLDIDREGKDTARIFNAGASVVIANSPTEIFTRSNAGTIPVIDDSVFRTCDLVIVEGYKDAPWDKVWVEPHGGGREERPELENVIGSIGGAGGIGYDDLEGIKKFLLDWLDGEVRKKPLFGGLLVGGSSRRMGEPKSLLDIGGKTMAETAYGTLKGCCDEVFLLGTGPLTESLSVLPRIADACGFSGPLAGIVSGSRFAPNADWLIMAVDMPSVTTGYLQKLIDLRRPGYRFIGASDPGGKAEPLCSLYSSQLLSAIESGFDGEMSIRKVLEKFGIKGDPALYDASLLKNVNSPGDLSV